MSLAAEIQIIAGLPVDFSAGEKARFQEIVVRAGEVTGTALTANIANARVLVMLKHEGIVRGVAALKRPQDTYRDKITKRAEFALPRSDVPYELGYVFIEPSLQGRGLSHRLVSEALAHNDGAAVFATVRADNGAMRTALYRAAFAEVGQMYIGRRGQLLGLLLRQGSGASVELTS